MIVGVPTEIKENENRVALVPGGCEELTIRGHRVLVQANAGDGSGFSDADYQAAGAEIVDSAESVFGQAEMIVKVKEPLEAEYGLIRSGQVVFTYFHFAASRSLTDAMLETGATCIAYETITPDGNTLPLLTPMSEVAGRMAVQEGAKYLERTQGGRGVLLGGIPGVPPGQVVILGGGVVGTNAAKIAAGMGAQVTIVDINLERLRYLSDVMPANVTPLMSNRTNIKTAIATADLVVGAVLVPGGAAPRLVTREDLSIMQRGAVVVDVAVDQGGCIETCRPTTHADPVYEVDGVMHYCVANMPGAVPFTSTLGLTNATLPYVLQVANLGVPKCLENPALALGVNVIAGHISYPAVAESFGLPHSPLAEVLAN